MAPAGPAGRPKVGQRGEGGRGKLWEEAEGKGLHSALAAGKRAYVHYITYILEDREFFGRNPGAQGTRLGSPHHW